VAIKGRKIKDPLVKEIVAKVGLLLTLAPLDFQWRKRGSTDGLTLVDSYARHMARRLPEERTIQGGPEGIIVLARKETVGTSITYTEAKLLINNWMSKVWQGRWKGNTSTTGILFPVADTGHFKKLKCKSRKELNGLFQLGTGHGLFGGHLRHWKKIDATCLLCLEEEETAWHLMKECPATAYWRDRPDPPDKRTQVKDILEFMKLKEIKELMECRALEC